MPSFMEVLLNLSFVRGIHGFCLFIWLKFCLTKSDDFYNQETVFSADILVQAGNARV